MIVRAGEKSLHPAWLQGAESRNWDLLVSWYGDSTYQPVSDERVCYFKGGKWDGIFKTVNRISGLSARYDYVWVPDDDIMSDCLAINRLFDITRSHSLKISQPALSWDSYFWHFLTLQAPNLRLRYTNFVEIMMPCFEIGFFLKCLPLFERTMSGYGLDSMWFAQLGENKTAIAIIDEVPMRHTRPVGKFLVSKMRALGKDLRSEFNETKKAFGLAEIAVPQCFSTVSLSGENSPFTVVECLKIYWSQLALVARSPQRLHWIFLLKSIPRCQLFQARRVAVRTVT